ncbi:MAG: HepT-like ribonuclease domain-containing protein [Candidatus Omnitrophota bacterium]
MRDYSLYVADILDAIEAIAEFVEGIEFEDFKQDDKTSSAVIRKFEIIGEAAKKIPESIKNKYPEITWKEMADYKSEAFSNTIRSSEYLS